MGIKKRVLILLFPLLVFPLIILFNRIVIEQTRALAPDPLQEVRSRSSKPEFVPGEIIVKFKQKPELSVSFNEGISDFREATKFSSVNSILEDFPVESISYLSEVKVEKQVVLGGRARLENFVKIKLKDKKTGLARPKELEKLFNFYDETEQSRLITRLKTDPNVEYAEPNYLYKITLAPNDPLFPQQWALSKIEATEGWEETTGNTKVKIAVIDTGFDYHHEDLQGRVWQNETEIPGNNIDDDGNGYIDDVGGWDFVDVGNDYCAEEEDCEDEDNDPADFFGHGTHVAGIIAASSNNGKGIAGVCWHCQVMNLRAGWKASDGYGYVDIAGAIKAVSYAIDNKADIINMSFGGSYSLALDIVLRDAYDQGIILIAAAGNSGMDVSDFPGSSSYVISVAATNQQDQKASFSNYKNNVDLAAPGVDILSLRAAGTDMYNDGQHIVNDKYYLASGTSMSAPIVAGVFGLVKSIHPLYTSQEAEKLVRLIVDLPQPGFNIGYGRINLNKAVTTDIPDAEATLIGPFENTYELFEIGETLEIRAKAKGANYKIELGEGFYPDQWKEITRQEASVDTMPNGAKLFTWQTDGLEEKLYTLKLTVFDNQGRYYYSWARLRFYDPTLGWERELSSYYSSGPTVADLNGDGKKEIVVVSARDVFTNSLNLYVFRHNGSDFFTHNPIDIEGGGGFSSSPAIGDVDGDGSPEIVVAGENWLENPSRSEGVIYIFRNDGSLMPGWNPRRVSDGISIESSWCYGWGFDRPCGGFPSSPVLVDFNRDGRKEIVLLSRYGKLYVFDSNGNNLPGFPKLLGEGFWFGNTFNPPAVGDIDGDGELEIVAALGENNHPGEGTFVYLVENNGSIPSGWPQKIVGDYIEYAYYSSLYCSPSVGDVDQDGKMEIFVASWNEQGGKIHGWQDNGEPVNNKWPVLAQGVFSNVSLGKFNRTDETIIFAGALSFNLNAAYAFSPSGDFLPGWPPLNSPWFSYGEPLVVDVDGDENQEAIFLSAYDQMAFAYEESGQDVEAWPKYIKDGSVRTPTITDLDADGFMEMVTVGESGTIYARKIPEAVAGPPNWGSYRHDERHTGAYTPFGDLDGDGLVNAVDVKTLLLRYKTSNAEADLYLDSIVNGMDFGELLKLISD